ncbi:expressed unknown protein [Seminavis robusta]|uniref:Uncharacterized protein n=1 Tax=Seminavis robusta TaxID=568900 RepID=A0A9N8EZR4_9STRA|nr:expressed unknown protein [Seminavis robusta]|eukprot:Sro2352_g324420.1 n/a (133) ;mRNA; f:7050-7448
MSSLLALLPSVGKPTAKKAMADVSLSVSSSNHKRRGEDGSGSTSRFSPNVSPKRSPKSTATGSRSKDRVARSDRNKDTSTSRKSPPRLTRNLSLKEGDHQNKKKAAPLCRTMSLASGQHKFERKSTNGKVQL